MKEVLRIKKGNIFNEKLKIPFDFGLVFQEEGVFYFDFYTSDSFNLLEAMESPENYFAGYYYSLTAITEENNEFKAFQLAAKEVIPHQAKLSMICYGYIQHHDVGIKSSEAESAEKVEERKQVLYYIELEGLKMNFLDVTENIKARGGVEIEDYNNWIHDHTSSLLIYNGSKTRTCNSFKFLFFKSRESENINVEISSDKWKGNNPNILYYDVFREFRTDLISLLSFINGGEVVLRKEHIGGYFCIGKVKTQTELTYSFKEIKNQKCNGYLPINNGFYRGSSPIGWIFMTCFDKFIAENKKFDLNSIIFYLNGAEQARSIEEKCFILIIAFERLAQKYLDSISAKDSFLIPDDVFKPIKDSLIDVLIANKDKFGKHFSSISGQMGDLHKVKSSSTKFKFTKLLEYANIEITEEIKNIIEVVRHKTIHHGEIGEDNQQKYYNYLILDEMLRDIILNMIGYDRDRVSRYRQNDRELPKKASSIKNTKGVLPGDAQ